MPAFKILLKVSRRFTVIRSALRCRHEQLSNGCPAHDQTVWLGVTCEGSSCPEKGGRAQICLEAQDADAFESCCQVRDYPSCLKISTHDSQSQSIPIIQMIVTYSVFVRTEYDPPPSLAYRSLDSGHETRSEG